MMKFWDYRGFKQLPYCCFRNIRKSFSGEYSQDWFLAYKRTTISVPPFRQSLRDSSIFPGNPHIQELYGFCFVFFHLERLFPNIPHSIKFDHLLLIILERTELQWCITHIFSPYVLSPKWLLLPWWVEHGPYVGSFILVHWQAKGQ